MTNNLPPTPGPGRPAPSHGAAVDQPADPGLDPTADAATHPPSGAKADPAEGWLRRLMHYVGRYRRGVLLSFGAAVLSTLIAVATPLIERWVVDHSIVAHDAPIAPALILLVLAGVARFGLGYVRRWWGGRLSLDVQYDLRDDVFASLQRLDGARLADLDTGQMVSRSNSDITLVQGLLAFLPNMSGQALLFVLSIVVMAVLSPLLTIVALLVGPALAVIGVRSRMRLFPATWDAQQKAGQVAGVVETDVTGVRVVKSYGQERRELLRLESSARTLFASRMRSVRFTARYSPALQAVPSLGQVGVLALGGYLVLHDRISLGTFLAFSTYLAELAAPVRILAGLLTIGQQAKAGVVRVMEVIDCQPEITEAADAGDLPTNGGAGVRFDNVTFGYVPSRPVLRDFSLDIQPGQAVALVGTSGSGTSTTVTLLSRFWDVQSGAVSIGGTDVRELKLAAVRQAVGLVSEDAFLFSTTVRENILYGHPDATDEQVRTAARLAQADRFIQALPGGYDTVVGEHGLTLSGGQRQRVALARALLTDPQVLVLDDATSAVDAAVEADILSALREVMRGRTTLLVAHRRSTLALADRVVLLDEGQVVDSGTEAELRERSALFRRLLADLPDATDPTSPAAVDVDAEVGGITAALWPYEDLDELPASFAETAAGGAPASGRPGGGGGRGLGRGTMTGGPISTALAGVPATPELLALVNGLPETHDEPKVELAAAAAADPKFGLGRLLRPLRYVLAGALVLVALDALASLTLPLLIRNGVNAALGENQAAILVRSSLLALGVVLLDWLITIMQTLVTGRLGERLLYTLRIKTFAQLQRLGLDYYEREMAGRIMTRMTTDVDALSSFLQTGVATALVSVLQLGGVLVLLLFLDPILGVTALAFLPVLAVATVIFRRISSAAYTEARERVSAVNADLQENLSGVQVAQAFTREAENQDRFRVLADRYRQSRLRAQRALSTYFPFVEMLSEVAAAVALGVGAQRVHSGAITAGGLIAFLLYLDLFFSPVQSLSQVFDGYQQAQVGLRRLAQLLRLPTSTPLPAAPVTVPEHLTGLIELNDVHFRYAGATSDALDGITLRIEPGESVALVGETGAGKSTLVKLLARLYDVTDGSVEVDGVDLREWDLSPFRQRLGVVPQEAYLFPGTVRDNIGYGRPEATDEQIEAAARAVGAHAAIARLPFGYLTPVGERGRSLSAGQRQLVSLARAELVDPDILLLDEATAALDLATEAEYISATERIRGTRTSVIVAHRLPTASRADRVIVLDQGRIVEQGPPAELRASGGAFARLWDIYAGSALVD
jgi:ATP-binding cassette subfamily B protein